MGGYSNFFSNMVVLLDCLVGSLTKDGSFVSEPGILVLFLPAQHRAVDVIEAFTPPW